MTSFDDVIRFMPFMRRRSPGTGVQTVKRASLTEW
jgi:hypothetical protein